MEARQSGERRVSKKEAEVLQAVAEHLTNAEIAARLYVSERTVESHVSSLLRKLGVGNRRELANLARSAVVEHHEEPPSLPAPLQLAIESGPLVGRAVELRWLLDVWRRAVGGRSLVAVVTGEAGIGKSRLVADFALRVHRQGATVLMGACFDGVSTPYQPFAQIIGEDLHGLGADDAHQRTGDNTTALDRVLRQRSDRSRPATVMPESVAPADVLAAISGYLARLATAKPLLVVVEDVHWATTSTRAALRHLAYTAGHAPLLVVATSRHTPPDLTDELSALLGDLARCPSVTRLGLGGLDETHVQTLLDRLEAGTPRLSPGHVWAETGGNPLLIRELVAGGSRRAAAGSSVHALLSLRSHRLSDEDNAVLDLAAVAGANFDADLIAHAAEMALLDVLDAMERAQSAGLVSATTTGRGRFCFVHDLFRSARYDCLPAGRRLELHRRVTVALTRHADDDRFIPALAHHACAAAPLIDPSLAIDYARRASDLAARSLAFEESTEHYRRALDVADLVEPPDLSLRCELTIRLGHMLAGAGDPQGRSLLRQAAPIARRLGDPHLLAAIAWALSPSAWAAPFSDPFAVSIAEEALALLGPEPSASRARVLAVLSGEYAARADPRSASATHRQDAVEVARQLDDPAVLGQVLLASQWSNRSPDSLQDRIAMADELDRLGERLGEPVFRLIAQGSQGANYFELGDVTASWRSERGYEALINSQMSPDSPIPHAHLAWRRTMRLFLTGDLVAAEQAAEAHLTLAQKTESAFAVNPMDHYLALLASIRFNQGRIGELTPVLQAAATAQPDAPERRAILALALARNGHLANACAILAPMTENPAAVRRDWQWYTTMIDLADAADLTAERDAAEVLYQELTPYSGRIARPSIVGVSHPIDLAVAQLALALGDHERAETIAGETAAAMRGIKLPIFLARALVQQAAAGLRLGRHRHQTRPLIDEALAIAQTTGADLIVEETSRYGLT